MPISESLHIVNLTPVILKTFWSIYSRWEWTGNLILGRSESFAGTSEISFQVGIGSSGATVFSGGTLYPSANYGKQNLKLLVLLSYLGGLKVRSHLINWFLSGITYVKPWTIWKNYQNLSAKNLKSHSNLKSAAIDDFTFAKLQCFSNIASKVEPYLKMYQTDNPMIPSMYFDLNA